MRQHPRAVERHGGRGPWPRDSIGLERRDPVWKVGGLLDRRVPAEDLLADAVDEQEHVDDADLDDGNPFASPTEEHNPFAAAAAEETNPFA